MERPELRGSHSRKAGKENKEAVREWMQLNRTGTQQKCQEDLKLSHVTVRKHMNAIIREMNDLNKLVMG